VLLQRRAAELAMPVERLLAEAHDRSWTPSEVAPNGKATKILRAPLGVNDGRGVVFISHTGDVQPSGFLNLVGGNIRWQSLLDIYRDSPVFRGVRDFTQLKGKCGLCEFKSICGGSRSRAYAITGDPMRSDPYCVYQPVRKERSNANGKSRPSRETDARPLCA
jgi:radical SAM protein with 4Fe4S-binding SPASM domain